MLFVGWFDLGGPPFCLPAPLPILSGFRLLKQNRSGRETIPNQSLLGKVRTTLYFTAFFRKHLTDRFHYMISIFEILNFLKIVYKRINILDHSTRSFLGECLKIRIILYQTRLDSKGSRVLSSHYDKLIQR